MRAGNKKKPPGCLSHICGTWQVISARGRRTGLYAPSLCLGSLLTCDMMQRRTKIITGQKPQDSFYIIGTAAGICAEFKWGQGRVVRYSPTMGLWKAKNQLTPLPSLPSLSKCFSNWSIYTNHLELLLKCGLRCRRSEVGPDFLHFKQALRWCWCCWSMDHSLSSKSLSHLRNKEPWWWDQSTLSNINVVLEIMAGHKATMVSISFSLLLHQPNWG